MAHFKVNDADIFFILKDQLNYGSLCELDRYRELDEDMLDMLVNEAIKFAMGEIDPLQEIGEKWGVVLENGVVRCPPEFKKAFRLCGENGWTAAARDVEYGGQGFPHMMRSVVNDLLYGACQSFNMAPSLSHGAAHLIESFASVDLKRRFVPKMFNGEWSGTMALTEAQAGSNLAAIKTTAYPDGDVFRIKGTKVFISWGDHDLTDNIVHLLLARIDGAPEGVRGISMFIVPKIRVLPDGLLGEPNDVICAGVEEKLGLHASPTCTLNFGDHGGCVGHLCGEPNKGLTYMFQMMNSARINTGVSGMTLASTAFQNALSYTKERIQGTGTRDGRRVDVPIIDHPDVRRMLLWMKAMVDGMRSMIYSGAFWADLGSEASDAEKRRHYNALVDFLTPIIKAYCSDMGFRVCETAIQCLGGYGFCKDYPLEQYLRDAKIMSLYEGTNGIQSIDLLGRKMRIDDAAPFKALMGEIEGFCARNAGDPRLGGEVQALAVVARRLGEVAVELSGRMKSDFAQWGSCTYPALLCFGDVTMAWRLLDMALVAKRAMEKNGENAFHIGKVMQATYFTGVTLPMTSARLETCVREGREVAEMPEEAF